MRVRVFPDPGWEKRITFVGALNMWLCALGLYWIAPVLIVTRRVEQPAWLLGSHRTSGVAHGPSWPS